MLQYDWLILWNYSKITKKEKLKYFNKWNNWRFESLIYLDFKLFTGSYFFFVISNPFQKPQILPSKTTFNLSLYLCLSTFFLHKLNLTKKKSRHLRPFLHANKLNTQGYIHTLHKRRNEYKIAWGERRRARYEFKYGGKNACTHTSSPLKRVEVWVNKRGWMAVGWLGKWVKGERFKDIFGCDDDYFAALYFTFPMRRLLHEFFTFHTLHFLIYFLLRN